MISSRFNDLDESVELLDSPGGVQLSARFSAPFEGEVVSWHATLFTPQAWAEHFCEAVPQRNIILIGFEPPPHITLYICLRVEAIDLPTLHKAIIMIRQYKRLQRGRHEYG